jgi:hypothetical protein
MGSLRDTMAYICKHYPHKGELSNARVTKMVYLADWRSAIIRGEQLTGTPWVFNHYGPFVYDVLDTAKDDPAFQVVSTRNMYGAPKDLIKVAPDVTYPSLEKDEKEILDFVIDSSADKNWDEFVRLVYSTYPIVAEERHTELNLVKLANEYQEVVPLLDSSS